jgi:hypothetical protein
MVRTLNPRTPSWWARLLKKLRIGVIFGPQDLKGVALISWLLRNSHGRWGRNTYPAQRDRAPAESQLHKLFRARDS